jgi:hypothetical protein
MTDPGWDDNQLLRDAKAKAEKLLASLIAQRDDLDRSAGKIAADQLARGRSVFTDAIGSTRKTLEQIDHALIATDPSLSTSKGI